MLVASGFDSVRVSIDGPREISDSQRGAGSYDKAMAGIEALHREKQRAGSDKPIISIIYTVTSENHLAIERFFLRELDLATIGWVTIQMQNFLTPKMGEVYARMLDSEFGIKSDGYWRGFVRSPDDFDEMDTAELARQVQVVQARLAEMGKGVLLLPPTFSAENLSAYLGAKWGVSLKESVNDKRDCLAVGDSCRATQVPRLYAEARPDVDMPRLLHIVFGGLGLRSDKKLLTSPMSASKIMNIVHSRSRRIRLLAANRHTARFGIS